MVSRLIVLAVICSVGYLLDGGLVAGTQLAIVPLLVAGGTALASYGAKKGIEAASNSKKKKDEQDPNKNVPNFSSSGSQWTGVAPAGSPGPQLSDEQKRTLAQQGWTQGADGTWTQAPGYGEQGLFDRKAFAPTSSFNWGQQATSAERGSAGTAQDIARSRSALDLLAARAQGRVPSIAEAAAQRALGRGQAAIASQAASVPGGYNPAAMRTAQYASADLAQRVAGDAALAASKERLGAEGLFAQMAAARAGQQGQLELGRGQLAARYRQLGFTEDQANRQAQQDLMRLLLQKYLGERGITQQDAASKRQRDAQLGSAAMNAGASLIGGVAKMA